MINNENNKTMKRILFIAMFSLAAICAQATHPDSTYHAFVEPGKTWCVHAFNVGMSHLQISYHFTSDVEIVNCLAYHKLICSEEGGNTDQLFREQDQCVYLYDKKTRKEYKIYDFTLEVGDKFEPEYGDYYNCEVKRVGTIATNGQYLKTITFEANDRMLDAAQRVEVEWIEGFGHRSLPLAGLFSESLPNSWTYYTAWVAYSDEIVNDVSPRCFLPLSFDVPYVGWHGQGFDKITVLQEEPCEEDLSYELVPDPTHDSYALHVYGKMLDNGSLINYIYCVCDENNRITLMNEESFSDVDCMGLFEVNLFFPYFDPDVQYTFIDRQGEHPVAVDNKKTSYRPFIEQGKVWTVGYFLAESKTPSSLYYYYFDGDTIIADRTCTKMRYQEASVEDLGNPWYNKYIGAVYEEGQRVYYAYPERDSLVLLYDFASPVGDSIVIDNGYGIRKGYIMKRSYNDADGYKGTTTYVGYLGSDALMYKWMEGVGNDVEPFYHMYPQATKEYAHKSLLSCTVGDEVIYLFVNGDNTEIGYDSDPFITPYFANEAKRQWLDFTHTVKTKPKAPRRVGTANTDNGQGLTGSYSDQQLFLNMKALLGSYTVTIRNADEAEVYRKNVQTSSLMAINADLSKLPQGIYTLNIENSEEAYTATLQLALDANAIRDITDALNAKHSTLNYYDLSGRRLFVPAGTAASAVLPPGIYIKDGKKICVK